MNLVTRFLAARRGRLLMKVGCWLVCFSLVLGLMLPQQRAEALVAELSIAAVASVAAAYLGACGMTFVTQGMDKDTLVSTTQRLIQEFLDTELGGITIQEWLGSVWNVFVLAGKIVMDRPLTEEFVSFAQWVAGKYVAQVGNNVVYSDRSITFADGSVYMLSYFVDESAFLSSDGDYLSPNYVLGTAIPMTSGTSESNYFEIIYYSGFSVKLYVCFDEDIEEFVFNFNRTYSGKSSGWSSYTYYYSRFAPFTFMLDRSGNLVIAMFEQSALSYYGANLDGVCLPSRYVKNLLSTSDLSINARSESMSYIPEGIDAEQGIALDVGAAATMDLDQVLQGVLDDVLAKTLTSTMTAADEKTEPVDPPTGEITDVDNLGLPALGAALTSRFPFSIPWDFFRAVQLLAAPAKAPYFEVDFMEPLADDVGGWQGDTTVILDFSEYAIIGQISRWTSTIGFCLMLAGATKRLIWTA